ncbi:MAG: Hsp33 family molecular chaperone HslO [Rubrivivax sp.]
MDELHRFVFEGLPVRGMLVRLDDSWREMIERRGESPHPAPVRTLLGEMVAAGVLMQANIKFGGALILQMSGDGPVKLAVAEVQPDLRFRGTASVVGELGADAQLQDMLNLHGQGRCAITLDPQPRLPGQQPYQGLVPLHGDRREPLQRLSQVLEHYMLQSEQLDTRLVLAADDRVAAGLLIQRLPVEGPSRMSGERNEDQIGLNEDFNRIAHLAATLSGEELRTLDVETVLHRLFHEERLTRFEPQHPRFVCSCTRERVRGMLLGLGQAEVDSIVAERGDVEVGCEFCGRMYRFDAVDVGEMFTPGRDQPAAPTSLQ